MPIFSRSFREFFKKQGLNVEDRRTMQSFSELYVSSKGEGTIIHLAQDSSFRFSPIVEFKEYPGLKVDNLKDIASNKLLALFSRSALRDFIDVYFLIFKGHFKKEELINLAQEKDPGFDLYWLAVAFHQVNEFKEASLQDMLMLNEPAQFSDIAAFFSQWREDIIKRLP